MNLSTTEIVFSWRIQGKDTLQDGIHFVRSFHNSSLISFVQRITRRNNRNKKREGVVEKTLRNLEARYKKGRKTTPDPSTNQEIKVHKTRYRRGKRETKEEELHHDLEMEHG